MLTSQKQVRDVPHFYSFLIEKDRTKKFSWASECREVFSFKFLNIIWWPLFRFNQRYFTHSFLVKYCKMLPGFGNLWNTIQKGSFAYNCLFLGIRPYQRSSQSTHLADVTTLALFFGDEFIDGVCKAAGKEKMRELLNKNPSRFYLKKKISEQKVQLVYRFNLNTLLPPQVMNQCTSKYGISYSGFYYLLEEFLQLMNNYLAAMPFAKAQLTADKIIDVCNTCLESYLHDVNSDPVKERIREVPGVLHFHETKTSYMQEKLLELRCILAGREYMMQNRQTKGWLNIMRVVQICDDLQDVLEDEGFQDNLVISVAFHKYPGEWEWLQQNRQWLLQKKHTAFLFSLYMPQTIHYCLNLASAKIHAMNWEQQKIMHYLLFKNWFVKENARGETQCISGQNFLNSLLLQLKENMPAASDQIMKTHLIHSCFHLKEGRKLLRSRLGWTLYYRLRYNLLSVSYEEKARALDKAIE